MHILTAHNLPKLVTYKKRRKEKITFNSKEAHLFSISS